MHNSNTIIAKYDIRGIQNYIFNTPRVRDAIGASAIVDNILEKALKFAVYSYADRNSLEKENMELNWKSASDEGSEKADAKHRADERVLPFRFNAQMDIQVMYIGGGNAYVIFKTKELAVEINKIMAKYVMDRTYSLQLAVAMVEKTENYHEDNHRLNIALSKAKADMPDTRPIGAVPVASIDMNTGDGLCSTNDVIKNLKCDIKNEQRLYEKFGDFLEADWNVFLNPKPMSAESILKEFAEKCFRKKDANAIKIFENYGTQKGEDSTIAIVHIDGNSMGLRIMKAMEGIADYDKAVNLMRNISYRIDSSYREVYYKMQDYFNSMDFKEKKSTKNNNCNILRIILAGDDITYICNAKIALASVQYFVKELSKKVNGKQNYTMLKFEDVCGEQLSKEELGNKKQLDYGFTVCAGVAYMHSHFPFMEAYHAAEECCSNAKNKAKASAVTKNGISSVLNWVDFHFCYSLLSTDLESTRDEEYVTRNGENLLLRPYCFNPDKEDPLNSFASLDQNIRYFQEVDDTDDGQTSVSNKNLPKSHAKTLRNLYPLGMERVAEFTAFLKSRQWKLPKSSFSFGSEKDEYACFAKLNEDTLMPDSEGKRFALWYDALEMVDDYISLEEIAKYPERSQEQEEA